MSDPAKPPIYPRYCFHLAPTVNTWCLFRVADVHGLDQHEGFEGENFYFYGNLPIKWVRIVGVVVAIDDYDAGRRVYTVDDSSGACIECTILISASQEGVDSAATATDAASKVDANPLAAAALLANINVGSVVDVKGGNIHLPGRAAAQYREDGPSTRHSTGGRALGKRGSSSSPRCWRSLGSCGTETSADVARRLNEAKRRQRGNANGSRR
ncbi:hypothetical protein FSOLCH5_004214 [Fusarium solani]